VINNLVTRGFRNPIRRLMSNKIPNLTPLLEVDKLIYPEGGFEQHAPFANYCGAKTNIFERKRRGWDKPTSKADAACKIHDWDYQGVYDKYKNRQIDRPQAEQLTREADNRLQQNIKNSGNAGLVNKMTGFIANNGMSLKKKMEDLHVMDKLNFSVGNDVIKDVEGSGKNPIRRLKKKAIKQLGKGKEKYAVSLYSPVKSKVTGKIYNNKMILKQKEGKVEYIDLKNKDLQSLIASIGSGIYKENYILI